MISMNGFSLSNYKEMEGHDGMVMRGTLKYGSRPIADFFDAGNGGQMEITPSKKYQEMYEKGMNEVKALFSRIGYQKNGATENNYRENPLSALIYLIADVNESVKNTKRWAKKEGFQTPAVGVAMVHLQDYEGLKSFVTMGAANSSILAKKESYKESCDEGFEIDKIVAIADNLSPRSIQVNL